MTDAWIGVALIGIALAVVLLAMAGLYLGSVLTRVAAALEALRRPAPVRPATSVSPGRGWEEPPRPAPKVAARTIHWP